MAQRYACAVGAFRSSSVPARIVRTRRYLKDLKRIGATVDEMNAIDLAIANDPIIGDVVPGLRGLRKLRFALAKRGKSGGGRAIYFLMLADKTAVLVTAFAKNEQTDLTQEQRTAALALLKEMKDGGQRF